MPGGDKRLYTALGMSFPKIHVATQKECPKNIDFIISAGISNIPSLWSKLDGMQECGMLMNVGIDETEMQDIVKPPTMTLFGTNFTMMIRIIGMERIKYKL